MCSYTAVVISAILLTVHGSPRKSFTRLRIISGLPQVRIYFSGNLVAGQRNDIFCCCQRQKMLFKDCCKF